MSERANVIARMLSQSPVAQAGGTARAWGGLGADYATQALMLMSMIQGWKPSRKVRAPGQGRCHVAENSGIRKRMRAGRRGLPGGYPSGEPVTGG